MEMARGGEICFDDGTGCDCVWCNMTDEEMEALFAGSGSTEHNAYVQDDDVLQF